MNLGDHLRTALFAILYVWGVGTSSVCASAEETQPPEMDILSIAFSDFPPYAIEAGVAFPQHQKEDCQYPEHSGYGIDVDFLIAVADEAGFRHQLSFYPHARLARQLETGHLDGTAGFFYAIANGKPKHQYILYDLGGATHLYLKTDRAKQLTEQHQLADLRIAMVRGEAFHNDFLNAALAEGGLSPAYAVATDYQQLFRLLDAGRVDAIAANNVLGQYIIQSEGYADIAASPLSFPYGKDPVEDGIYIALRRDLPAAHVERLRAATEKLLEAGVFHCIRLKYGILSNNH